MSRADVVIAAFNAQRYLAEAIGSVIAQTRGVSRIIVVDDGSADATAEIAASFGACVQLVRQRNRGPAAARNAGIARSGGELLAFLDADDRWAPDKLSRQIDALDGDRALDFVLCDLRCFASPDLGGAERRALEAGHRVRAQGWCVSAMLVRRAAFDRVGAFAEDLRVGEAIDWFNRARVAGLRYRVLDEVLLDRRLHRDNLTRRLGPVQLGYLVAVKRHLNRVRAKKTAETAP